MVQLFIIYGLAHKIGIRRGNFDLQIACLASFAPLFPITGKFRYAGKLHQDPEFCKRLFQVPSINLTREGHYLGYDEALETYGVYFIKQIILGNLVMMKVYVDKYKGVKKKWID